MANPIIPEYLQPKLSLVRPTVATAPDAKVSGLGMSVIPTWVGPVAAALGAIGIAVQAMTPSYTIAFAIAAWVIKACAVIGPISAGMRK